MSILEQLRSPDDIKSYNFDELKQLAKEVRELMINVVAKTGGHLASSLGVVELTIALLRTFDVKNDKLIWDVGHQGYAYKILTDRKQKFNTLRTFKGVSGFINANESSYDAFTVGHAATSISAALGIKCGSDHLGIPGNIVSIIGDGSISSGLSFEGINNLNQLDKKLIIVLNDNEMCISHNVGALSSYLSKIMSGQVYTKFRSDLKTFFKHAPMGEHFLQLAKKIEEGLIGLFTPGILFEQLGLKYIGPINGHDLKELEIALRNAELQIKPVLVHVRTKKGYGYVYAEKDPSKFHSIAPFDILTGKSVKITKTNSYSQIAGKTVTELAMEDASKVAITAAMEEGVGLKDFAKLFPERFYDVGIAEEHGAVFAAGLAKAGMKPFYFIYSTFLQRAFDEIIHDIALQKLPVRLLIDRAGLVGEDGATHHGVFDISYLKLIPNFVIMAPKDDFELVEMIKMTDYLNCPSAIRYPRGEIDAYEDLPNNKLTYGKAEIIYNEGSVAIISVGHIFSVAYDLYKLFKKTIGPQALINVRFIKPLDIDSIYEVVNDKDVIVILEEGVMKGGINEEIALSLYERGVKSKILRFAIPDYFIEHGSIEELRKLVGLNSKNILQIILEYEKIKI
jgi:1-deoxy-D-xylulose-5-phosphate synthase